MLLAEASEKLIEEVASELDVPAPQIAIHCSDESKHCHAPLGQQTNVLPQAGRVFALQVSVAGLIGKGIGKSEGCTDEPNGIGKFSGCSGAPNGIGKSVLRLVLLPPLTRIPFLFGSQQVHEWSLQQ